MEDKIRKIDELANEILYDLKDLSKEEQTFNMGIFQGSKSRAFLIAKRLIILGLSVEEVSKITDLSSFEIKNFINYD